MAGKIGCTVSGFIMYTVGLLQINLVTVISMERYYIIYKPFNISKITYRWIINFYSIFIIIKLIEKS